jgi:hypothetical protein
MEEVRSDLMTSIRKGGVFFYGRLWDWNERFQLSLILPKEET